MEILQLIETKLNGFGITIEPQVTEITLAEVDQAIKNYCHIDCIPKGLLFVRANMVVDYIRYMESNKPSEDGQINASTKLGPLTSIKAGDVQYNFADGNTKAQTHNAHMVDLDSLTHNYTNQLNNYRRVPW